jgi:hydrogenase nickel incorporation protein HypB
MCLECGCGLPGPTKINGNPADGVNLPLTPQHPHTYTHSHEDEHDHPLDHEHEHTHRHVEVQQSILTANDRLAERNRGFFRALDLLVLNVLSSPGSGKTTFLQKTIELMGDSARCGVIVGDLETDNDARRLRTTGAPVVQISTGTLCHLDAEMVARAVEEVGPKALDVLFIENVGNLVCPSGFDLGEDLRVALLSVTEGEDKPLKYPPLFRFADIVVVTKVDLSAVCEFDRKTALDNIHLVNPKVQLFEVSAKTGDGMEAWRKYIVELHSQHNPKR